MPTSNIKNITPIMSEVAKFKTAKSILDIGCGFGKFGVLCREHFDIRFKRINKKDWKVKIDTIEIWQNYLSELHDYIYDNITMGNILSMAKDLPQYDLILMIDVIEHIHFNDGKRLLQTLATKFNQGMVISFPENFTTGACSDWENPYEEHQCLWKYEYLTPLFSNITKLSNTVFCARR